MQWGILKRFFISGLTKQGLKSFLIPNVHVRYVTVLDFGVQHHLLGYHLLGLA